MSEVSQPCAMSSPLHLVVSSTILLTWTPLLSSWLARSLTSGAPTYTVSVPAVRADRVGSPPPTNTMVPGSAPCTTVVCSRLCGSSVVSTAAPVMIFRVDAGDCSASAFWSNSTALATGSTT